MADVGLVEYHQHLSSSNIASSPKLDSLTAPRTMNIGSEFVVSSPTVMAQHDQLPSPLTQEGRGSLPHQIDIDHSNHAKMRRKSLKGGPSTNAVKRSQSTPNVRGMSTGSDAAMSLADKRRNKLGYHRTSVACVHCRRRKIRCLLAPDDPQKRCSNCIRLKKECNFFPVDQQPPAERRPRTGSKQEGATGDTSTSSSSSPNMPTPHIGDHGDHFNYASMPMSAHPFSTTSFSLGTTTMSPPGSAAPITTRFDIDGPPGSGWDPRFFDSGQIPTGHPLTEEHANGYWKVPEPPMTSPFSPYSSGPPSSMFHQSSFSSYSSAPSRNEGNGWQAQPMRSLSYTPVGDHHRNDSYPAPYPADMRRSTVDMLPPSQPPSIHHSSATSSTASMVESPVAPLSGPQTTQTMMHYNAPPGWNTVPSQSPKTVDFGGSWYQEPSQLAKVQEEDITHYTDNTQPSMYASTAPH